MITKRPAVITDNSVVDLRSFLGKSYIYTKRRCWFEEDRIVSGYWDLPVLSSSVHLPEPS